MLGLFLKMFSCIHSLISPALICMSTGLIVSETWQEYVTYYWILIPGAAINSHFPIFVILSSNKVQAKVSACTTGAHDLLGTPRWFWCLCPHHWSFVSQLANRPISQKHPLKSRPMNSVTWEEYEFDCILSFYWFVWNLVFWGWVCFFSSISYRNDSKVYQVWWDYQGTGRYIRGWCQRSSDWCMWLSGSQDNLWEQSHCHNLNPCNHWV